MAVRWYSARGAGSSRVTDDMDPEEKRRMIAEEARMEALRNAGNALRMYNEEKRTENGGTLLALRDVAKREQERQRQETIRNMPTDVRTNTYRREATTPASTLVPEPPSGFTYNKNNTRLQTERIPSDTLRAPNMAEKYLNPIANPINAFTSSMQRMIPGNELITKAADATVGLFRGSDKTSDLRKAQRLEDQMLEERYPRASLTGAATGLAGSMAAIPGVGNTQMYQKAGALAKTGMMAGEGAAYGAVNQVESNMANDRPLGEGVGTSTLMGMGLGGLLGLASTRFTQWLERTGTPNTPEAVNKFLTEAPEARSIINQLPGGRSERAMELLREELSKTPGVNMRPSTPAIERNMMPSYRDAVTNIPPASTPQRLLDAAPERLALRQAPDTPRLPPSTMRSESFQPPVGDQARYGVSQFDSIPPNRYLDAVGNPSPGQATPVTNDKARQFWQQLTPEERNFMFNERMGKPGEATETLNKNQLKALRNVLGEGTEYGRNANDEFLTRLWNQLTDEQKSYVLRNKFGDDVNFNSGERTVAQETGSVTPAASTVNGTPPATPEFSSIEPVQPYRPAGSPHDVVPVGQTPADIEVAMTSSIARQADDVMYESIADAAENVSRVMPAPAKPKPVDDGIITREANLPLADDTPGVKINNNTMADDMTADEALDFYNRFYDEGIAAQPGSKLLMFIENSAKKSEVTAPEVLDNLARNTPRRMPIPMKETWDKAWAKVTDDFDAAKAAWMNLDGISHPDHSALGMAVLVKLMRQGDFKAATDLMVDLAMKAAEAGSGINMLKAFQMLSPEGWVQLANRQVKKMNKVLTEAGYKPEDWINQGVKMADGGGITPDDAQKILRLYDEYYRLTPQQQVERQGQKIVAQYKKIMEGYVPATAGDKLRSFQRVNLLFRTISLMRNFVGNLGYGVRVVPSLYGQAAADIVTTKLSKFAQESPNHYLSKFVPNGIKELEAQRTMYAPSWSRINPYEATKEVTGATLKFAKSKVGEKVGQLTGRGIPDAERMAGSGAANWLFRQTARGTDKLYDAGILSDRFVPKQNPRTSFGQAVNDVFEDRALGIDTSPTGTQLEYSTNVQNAWKDWTNADLSPFPTSIEAARQKIQDAKDLIAAGHKELGKVAVSEAVNAFKYTTGNIYQTADDVVKTALKLGDRPFYQLYYDSFVVGYQKTMWKQLSEAEKAATKWTDIQVPDQMVQRAQQFALEKTFQDINKISQFAIDARNLVNHWGFISASGKKFGAGNIVAPFVLTPANMVARALDDNVFAVSNFAEQAYRAARTGKGFDQYKFTKALSDLPGLALIFAGIYGYRAGWLTGGIPDDKDARLHQDQNLNTGFYSIKIPGTDKWISYDWAQPLSINLAAGADYGRAIDEGKQNEVLAALSGGTNTLLNLPMLQTVQRMFGGYSSTGNSNVTENLSKITAQAGSQFIPMGGVMQSLNQTFDPYMRENDDPNVWMKYGVNPMRQRVLPAFPGEGGRYPQDVNETSFFSRPALPGKVNTWGEPMMESNFLETWLSPARIREASKDYTDNELQRMYAESGETKQFPRYMDFDIKRTVNGETQSYSMNAQERVQYQMAYGQLARGAVEEFMSTYYYDQMDDAERANEISQIYSEIEGILKEEYFQQRRN